MRRKINKVDVDDMKGEMGEKLIEVEREVERARKERGREREKYAC